MISNLLFSSFYFRDHARKPKSAPSKWDTLDLGSDSSQEKCNPNSKKLLQDFDQDLSFNASPRFEQNSPLLKNPKHTPTGRFFNGGPNFKESSPRHAKNPKQTPYPKMARKELGINKNRNDSCNCSRAESASREDVLQLTNDMVDFIGEERAFKILFPILESLKR